MTMSESSAPLYMIRVLLDEVVEIGGDILAKTIEEKVDLVLGMPIYKNLDRDRLIATLQGEYTIKTGESSVLDDNPDHVDWRPDRSQMYRWQRYRLWLSSKEKALASEVIRSLDTESDKILARIENPLRPGLWDTRGMVVGSVQMGKTSNYTGLICKALDAGYKMVVVLAGHTNALREQTQFRIDEGVIGIDTGLYDRQEQNLVRKIGVGNKTLPDGVEPVTDWFTTTHDGDFSQDSARIQHPSKDYPGIFVIKKNVHSLRHLILWLNRWVDKSDPLLLVDDECDWGSIDTGGDEDPSTINALVRNILSDRDRSAYVGYTATPFANLFIDINEDEGLGDDLFPKNFIVNLPVPSNYIGPEKLFGVSGLEDLDKTDGLPLIRSDLVNKETWIPPKHDKDFIPGPIPDSLKESIKSFILSVAVRSFRGQKDHNSMLVHVTRFIKVQNRIQELVDAEVIYLRQVFRYADIENGDRTLSEFKNIFETDFLTTAMNMRNNKEDPFAPNSPESWEDIEPFLHEILEAIEVRAFNGSNSDAFDYDNRSGRKRTVIAIGGDKLSRGLTLEGLSVCYFLRQSKMYDTLMQMGRWFGYKDGYTDVCRLYAPTVICKFFEHITAATIELKQDFEHMEMTKKTPMDFRLRVRTHPTTLRISGPRKTRHSDIVRLSFSGNLQQTIAFKHSAASGNRELLGSMVAEFEANSRAESSRENDGWLWSGISGDRILRFLEEHGIGQSDNIQVLSHRVRTYIKEQITKSELTDWTVFLASNRTNQRSGQLTTIGTHQYGIFLRSQEFEDLRESREGIYDISTLRGDRKHEMVDLTDDQLDKVLVKTVANWEKRGRKNSKGSTLSPKPVVPDPLVAREVRDPKNGLMMIYPIVSDLKEFEDYHVAWAISFPTTDTARVFNYRQPTWQINKQMEFDF